MATFANVLDRARLLAVGMRGDAHSSPLPDNDYVAEVLYPNVMKEVVLRAGSDPLKEKDVRTTHSISVTSGSASMPTAVAMECIESAIVNIRPETRAILSMDGGANNATVTSHGYYTGMPVTFTTTGAQIGGGLSAGTTYYVLVSDSNTLQFATSLDNALNSTPMDLTLVEPEGTVLINPSITWGTASYVHKYHDYTRTMHSPFYYWSSDAGTFYFRVGAWESMTPIVNKNYLNAFTGTVSMIAVTFPIVSGGSVQIIAGTDLSSDIVDDIVYALAEAMVRGINAS